MSSKEENIENLPFFDEAHRESASLFLFLSPRNGHIRVVPACSRNEQQRRAKGLSLSLSVYQQKVNYGIIPKKRNRTRRSLSYTFHLSTSVRSSFFSRPNIGSFSPNSMPIPFHPGLIMWLLVPFPRMRNANYSTMNRPSPDRDRTTVSSRVYTANNTCNNSGGCVNYEEDE